MLSRDPHKVSFPSRSPSRRSFLFFSPSPFPFTAPEFHQFSQRLSNFSRLTANALSFTAAAVPSHRGCLLLHELLPSAVPSQGAAAHCGTSRPRFTQPTAHDELREGHMPCSFPVAVRRRRPDAPELACSFGRPLTEICDEARGTKDTTTRVLAIEAHSFLPSYFLGCC